VEIPRVQPRFLIAESEPTSRELLVSYLSKVGWEYQIADPHGDVFTQAKATPSTIVLTDLAFPEMDKISCLKQFKRCAPEIPVIVVTRECSVEDVLTSIREGASDILLQPFDLEGLKKSVARICGDDARSQDERLLYQGLTLEESSFVLSARDVAQGIGTLGIIERLYRVGKIDKDLRLKIQLAFQEALANSLEHGALELESRWKDEYDNEGVDTFSRTRRERLLSEEYGKRELRITVKATLTRLEITIADSGPGFILEENTPTFDSGSMLKCYGRGLGIISGTMDEVLFSRRGAEICMVKYLS
jgi:CheY-like chemotaxis protein